MSERTFFPNPGERTFCPNPDRTFFPNPARTFLPNPQRTFFPNPARTFFPNPARTFFPNIGQTFFPNPGRTSSPNGAPSTPVHALIVCAAGPPIPARGATRATASPTSGPPPRNCLALPSSCLVSTTSHDIRDNLRVSNHPPWKVVRPRALLQHALVANKLSAGSAKPTANTQVEAALVYQCSPSQADPNRKHRVYFEGVCVSATGQYLSQSPLFGTLENGNRILATHRGCDMRKQGRAQDQTLAPRGSQSRQARVDNHCTQRRREETTKRTD